MGDDLHLGPILLSVCLNQSVDDEVCDHFLVLLRTKCKTMFRVIPSDQLASDIPGPRDFMRVRLLIRSLFH